MKPFLFFWLLRFLTACARPAPDASAPGYGMAAPAYVVLTQKALTYQADFDTESWSRMLTDSVEFTAPASQRVWRGKQAVVVGWKHWQQQTGVTQMELTEFTHLPIQTTQLLPLWDKAGVYVVSYCRTRLWLRDGRQTSLLMNLCCHFDTTGHIDRYLMLHQ